MQVFLVWVPPAMAVGSFGLAIFLARRTILREAFKEQEKKDQVNSERHAVTEAKVEKLDWRVERLEHLTHSSVTPQDQHTT